MSKADAELSGDLSDPHVKRPMQRRAPEIRSTGVNRPLVLIVDDVAENLLALEGTLRHDDIEIVTALSGCAALDILLERDVAVAIIDVQMPEMDGFELASLMRGVEKTRCVPIVFATAGSKEESRVFKGYESGAVDYLFKPIDPQILRGKVNAFVTLEQQRQQLQHAARMREMFIGVLGHDLRNPLNSILMAAELIQLSSSDKAIADAIQLVLRGGHRMARLIDQLLDVSRFRIGGGITLFPQPADFRELTDQVLSEFEDRRQRFQVDVCGDPRGTWDTDRVLQVVSNLVGNAIRYSPAGSPICIRIQGQHKDTLDIQIHNVGAPIPEELHDVLFEPFRGSEPGGSKSKGLGLGLYITKEIVLAHGGMVSFESSEEFGTNFIVNIPRHTTGRESHIGVLS